REIARAIVGLDRARAGFIPVEGAVVDATATVEGVRAGSAYVPDARKRDGIVQSAGSKGSLRLPVLRRRWAGGWGWRSPGRGPVNDQVEARGPSPPVIERAVDTLSGGNEQKVVIAKWLAAKPRVLILDEPTRGVDVGAKADIHAIIGELAKAGTAIL